MPGLVSGPPVPPPENHCRTSRRPCLRHDDNLTTERQTFVTHLECAATGEHHAADAIHNLSRAGKPLLVRYDLAGVRNALSKEALARRAPDLWRYRELLPVRRTADIVSLGEAMTPIVPLPKLAAKASGSELLVKDEGRLPTGSFKARGLVMAVSMAKADQRQCRRRARRLCEPCRDQDDDLLPRRHAGSECQRDRPARRGGVPRQRLDRRLRQDRR